MIHKELNLKVIKKINLYISISALILFITCAITILGYYHADEHFQIIEFTGLKTGFTSSNSLTWEYAAQLRSSLQILFAYATLKFCDLIAITNPYYQLMVLKSISAIYAVIVINYFVNSTQHLFSNNRVFYRIISFSIWFIPIVSLRFSSETWGGITTLLALSFFQKKYLNTNQNTNKVFFILGVLLGAAFLFRYQMIFMSIGLFFWLLLYKKEKITTLFRLILGGIFSVFVGILIDYWYYKELVFSFWNYFYGNIIKDIASSFGTSPWYYYLHQIWNIPFFGLLIFISMLVFIYKKSNSVYLWIIVPFFVIHSLVAHKEFRFLFPLIYFMPFIIMVFYNYLQHLFFKKNRLINLLLMSLFVILNFIFIATSILKGEDDNGRHKVSKFLFDHYKTKSINIISTPYSSPYSPFGAYPKFYLQNTNFTETKLKSLCHLDSTKIDPNKLNFFVTRKVSLQLNPECEQIISELGFKKIMQSVDNLPETIITKFYNPKFKSSVLIVYLRN